MGTRLVIKGADFSKEMPPTLDVSITLEAGKFVLSCDNQSEDIKIYYTLDGSNPSTSSYLYTEPLQAEFGITIKAVAYKGVEKGNISIYEANKLSEFLEWQNGYYDFGSGLFVGEGATAILHKCSKILYNIELLKEYTKAEVYEGYELRIMYYSTNSDNDLLFSSNASNKVALSKETGVNYFTINLRYKSQADISSIDAERFAKMTGLSFE